MRMWAGWLDCFEAYHSLDDPVAYVECYRRALVHYNDVATMSRQERVRNLALESGRRIRRKLRMVEIGVSQKQFSIPAEIVFWGEPRERLNGTVWFVTDRQGKTSELAFSGRRLILSTPREKTSLDYHLTILGEGQFEVHANGTSGRGKTIAINVRIAGNSLFGDVLMSGDADQIIVRQLRGHLQLGEIALFLRGRKPEIGRPASSFELSPRTLEQPPDAKPHAQPKSVKIPVLDSPRLPSSKRP